jgi:hypothetical protein
MAADRPGAMEPVSERLPARIQAARPHLLTWLLPSRNESVRASGPMTAKRSEHIALLDFGSNAVRFMPVRVVRDGFRVVDEARVRTGQLD